MAMFRRPRAVEDNLATAFAPSPFIYTEVTGTQCAFVLLDGYFVKSIHEGLIKAIGGRKVSIVPGGKIARELCTQGLQHQNCSAGYKLPEDIHVEASVCISA